MFHRAGFDTFTACVALVDINDEDSFFLLKGHSRLQGLIVLSGFGNPEIPEIQLPDGCLRQRALTSGYELSRSAALNVLAVSVVASMI